MEKGQVGILSYETNEGFREQLVCKMADITEYGYDVELKHYDYVLRITRGEVFTSSQLIGHNASFTPR